MPRQNTELDSQNSEARSDDLRTWIGNPSQLGHASNSRCSSESLRHKTCIARCDSAGVGWAFWRTWCNLICDMCYSAQNTIRGWFEPRCFDCQVLCFVWAWALNGIRVYCTSFYMFHSFIKFSIRQFLDVTPWFERPSAWSPLPK